MSTGRAPAVRCPSREGTTEMEDFPIYQAPVTEPAYVLALEARFWEFDLPWGTNLLFRKLSGQSASLSGASSP